jgi:hypothetical protein
MGLVRICRVNSPFFSFFFSNKGLGNVTILPKISLFIKLRLSEAFLDSAISALAPLAGTRYSGWRLNQVPSSIG